MRAVAPAVEIEVEGRALSVSSPERVVWPEAGFTKRDVLDYYLAVAPALLRHTAGRPVTLARFPEGIDRYGWYQTQCRAHPDWISTRRVGTQDYCVLDGVASLVWAVNVGTIEVHPLLSRGERTDEPTAVVFDLDPGPPADLLDCSFVALALRDTLAAAGFASHAKTSGSLGLHVFVPLNVPHAFAETKEFARAAAAGLARRQPDRVVDVSKRSVRTGKVLIDWVQNQPTRSTIAPYSLRAMRYPTVSTPVSWEELEAALAARAPDRLVFSPRDVVARLERGGDLFGPVVDLKQTLR